MTPPAKRWRRTWLRCCEISRRSSSSTDSLDVSTGDEYGRARTPGRRGRDARTPYRLPRMDVIFYTRADCHLCEQAKASIRAAVSLHRLPITLREVDIDADPDLRARYTDDVPGI